MALHIDIIRDPSQSNATGTFGQLRIAGQRFCFTCEQPWNDNLQGRSCIPAGDYELLPYESPEHGSTVVFHNPALGVYGWAELIPPGETGRTVCEIHSANWPFQLKGCVAVGDAIAVIGQNGKGVTNSRATLSQLALRWGNRKNLTAKISGLG